MGVPGGTTNTYLVSEPGVLVDPVAGVARLDVEPTEIGHIAVTHTHPDHVAGVATVVRETDATVWAFAPYRDRFVDETGIEPDRTFRAGESIGSTGVQVLGLPGHTPDHVGYTVGSSAVIGDLARADGSVMVGDSDGDMRAYYTSLRRLIHSGIETAYPGHGPPIEDPAGRLRELLAHRLERERKVFRAVDSGAETPSEIVAAAYEKDLTGVEDAAEETVRAHLSKLAVEGRVEWDGSVARIP